MEVDINPITLDTTKQLARLYPAAAPAHGEQTLLEASEAQQGHGAADGRILDSFFAADFITPKQRHRGDQPSDPESYGIQYVRYLHQFRTEQQRRDPSLGARSGFVRRIVSELVGRTRWEQTVRENILALAIIVQARIEAGTEDRAAGPLLAGEFAKSRLPACLWRSIQVHLTGEEAAGERAVVRPDELEVAIELLFLFTHWALDARQPPPQQPQMLALGLRSVHRVGLAVELFTRYARQAPRKRPAKAGKLAEPPAAAGAEVGRVQRIRLGHKALMLLDATWVALVGDEASALRRIDGGAAADEDEADGGAAGGQRQQRRGVRRSGVARDAVRQIRESADKYPQLGAAMQAEADRLLPFVHPFDGHLTRASQLARFGPMRPREHVPQPQPPVGSPSTQMLLADMVFSSAGAGPASLGGGLASSRPLQPPRATRDAIAAYIAAARMNRSEREYAEWWRRLVRARGAPLSLTMNGGRGSDVTVNYAQPQQPQQPQPQAQRYAFCGIVEAEDIPALEAALDGHADKVAWPAHTDPEPDQQISSAMYRALFPLLPALCRALVRTIANWSPAERELPQRPGGVAAAGGGGGGGGSPQVSEATCLGVVAYPAWAELACAATQQQQQQQHQNLQQGGTAPATPSSPLGGSNVKRLDRAPSSISIGSVAAAAASSAAAAATAPTARVVAEVSARLLTQYAQWQAIGRLLMRMIVGLQANHVLQADYMAQLLMNENFIPAVFWWLGTADLALCTAPPPALRLRSFSAEYAREQQRVADDAAAAAAAAAALADRTEVGADADADDTSSPPSSPSSSSSSSAAPWWPALHGLCDCLRSLRRLTSHNGLRKGLLYKNKALYFYSRAIRTPHLPTRRIAAELLRDLMPVVSRKQKLASMDVMAHVYLYAMPALADAFWLCDFALDPQIEMHRHVELLRLLHFYHYEQFGLRLPKDPALFPSLVSQAVEGAGGENGAGTGSGGQRAQQSPTHQQPQPQPQHNSNYQQQQQQQHLSVRHKVSSSSAPSAFTYSYPATTPAKIHKKAFAPASSTTTRASPATSCARQSGAAVGEYSWLLWDSDLEDTLNEVYTPKT
ncbi:hypothetical protein LPJ53_002071 [Coemansia erecta]|uniref:Far11/STRP C-terminal domain-containing protein n=1 Tax=Coemansia erecta TaxID=147472 RepID=A0A9W7XYU2_9FUNG|nr:hypothetical protein LPJ53_002071 [Coemansia erecta]